MNTSTSTVNDAPFTLPIAPELARTATSTARTPHDTTIDVICGGTRPRATRKSRHGSYPPPGSELLPPPYEDAELPAYTADPNTEHITLAMYLFKFGFLFPPFWILGAIILIRPLAAPAPSKSGEERQQLAQIIRETELRWARRCAWALFVLLVLAGSAAAVAFGIWHL